VVSPWAWVVPAGLGAVIGSLGAAWLARVLFGPAEGGLFTGGMSTALSLFAGGVAGAIALVSLFAFLATRPAYLAALRRYLGEKGPGPARLLRDGLPTFAAWLVVWALRPRALPPADDERRAHLRAIIEPLLLQQADLVLAWCRPLPRAQATESACANPPGPLPEPLLQALTAFRIACQSNSASPEDVRHAAAAFVQRAEEEGYAWKSVPTGTPYGEELAGEFDRFALIGPGQPVETLRPAVLFRSTVQERGLLRRLPDRPDKPPKPSGAPE
jgi:hypothetical protein